MQPEEIKAYTREVAEKLGESKEVPVSQLKAVITHMGREFVEDHLAQTAQIEEEGGLKIENGRRRRTLGGVFFYIIKDKIPADKRRDIFPGYGNRNKGDVVEWDKRLDHITELLEQDDDLHGEMQYVNVTLHGKVGTVYKHDNSVITTIKHSHKRVPMPKGVPTPPEDAITYVVYMSVKHWEPVERALKKNPNDRVIVEGTVVLDHETQTLALLAQSVTTKQLFKQKRQKEAQKADKTPKKAGSKSNDKQKQPAAENGGSNAGKQSNMPAGMSEKDAAELRQLYSAAETLRERVAAMEAEGKKAGVGMTKTLLKRTEKQIEALEKKYS